jgi:hypothetical protein
MTGGKLLFIIVLLISSVAPASAQRTTREAKTPAPQRASSPQPTSQNNSQDVPPESADLAITATVTAKELRFEVVPNPTVVFSGKPQRNTVWDAVRDNLPNPVQPGVTYRNIGIRLKIVSRFADIERIVAEALGETPVTDSIPQKEDAPPQQPVQPPVSTSQPNGGQPK